MGIQRQVDGKEEERSGRGEGERKGRWIMPTYIY